MIYLDVIHADKKEPIDRSNKSLVDDETTEEQNKETIKKEEKM